MNAVGRCPGDRGPKRGRGRLGKGTEDVEGDDEDEGSGSIVDDGDESGENDENDDDDEDWDGGSKQPDTMNQHMNKFNRPTGPAPRAYPGSCTSPTRPRRSTCSSDLTITTLNV